jgi:ABC-type transport system involved in cytochrome c biogenesis permease component
MTTPIWLQLLIYALAVARLTGLVVADALTEDIRDGILDRLDDRPRTLGSYLSTLITCPWCAGMWISIVASPLVWFFHGSAFMLIPALFLAFSQFIGMTASVGR